MIRIVSDSSSDITVSQAKEMNIDLVPLSINFEGSTYDPLEDETFATFYTMLAKAKTLPTTSQPNPESFLSIFDEAKLAGDDVVVITLSKKISGTYENALLAKDLSGYDRISVIDSLSAVIGHRFLVESAVNLRAEGADAQTIVAHVEEASRRLVLVGGLDTLEYLRKGGRIPKSAETLGTIIGIKPLVKLVDGSIEMAGKARGRKGAVKSLLKLVEGEKPIDPQSLVYFGYTENDELCKSFQKLVTEKYGLTNTVCYPIGSVIGTHVGPGAFAIVYLPKD